MKQRDLMFGFGLFGALGMMAQSPFVGSLPPTEGSGDYYLYQVESGKWLQNNQRVRGQWTTHAQLDKNGFDVEVIAIDGGWQLNPKLGSNHSINSGGDRFYMDTNHGVSPWSFEPVEMSEVSNAFKIQALVWDELNEPYYLGEKDDELSDNAENLTWQLVSRADRIEWMKNAVADGPVDATWLIPAQDLGRNDERRSQWTHKWTADGSGIGLGGADFNSVQEAWHRATNYVDYIILKDIPNGTYRFTVQGWYRDTEVESAELQQRMADGTEVLRASYFAGAASAELMPISKNASTEEVAGKYSYHIEPAGIWVPNSLNDASEVFSDGAYTNEWIETTVTDGTLIIGISKREADHRDWLVYDNFQLQYVSQDAPAADLSGLKSELETMIAEANGLDSTPVLAAAIEEANAAVASESASVLRDAIFSLQTVLSGIKVSKSEIALYAEIKKFCVEEGVDTTSADEIYMTAANRDDYNRAIKELRYARRRAHADKHEDVFAGSPVAAGEFYLYNVGQKQFLSGGSDWGAHAALSMPGRLVVLEEEDAASNAYHINTNLFNGEDKHYLNYRGYMDAPIAGAWKFIPVDGKENVYNIVQNDYQDVHVGWAPYADTDNKNNDETTVGTELRNLAADDLNAQWKLVSRAERMALMENASIDNPVDVSFLIESPNFNQREGADMLWSFANGNIWEYGGNHYDFAAESWNTTDFDMNQELNGLPAGVYKASVQGFYRNGDHGDQPDLEFSQNAYLYCGSDEADDVLLPNITAESGMVPGEGDDAVAEDGTVYNYPNGIVQATNFFKNGLYRTYTVINVAEGDPVILGVGKDVQGAEKDWVVADNFRLTYYGKSTTKDEVKDMLSSGVVPVIDNSDEAKGDNRIYNLQGIEVTNLTAPGIYIRNGKKFVVR